jgi:hypothetical protein
VVEGREEAEAEVEAERKTLRFRRRFKDDLSSSAPQQSIGRIRRDVLCSSAGQLGFTLSSAF